MLSIRKAMEALPLVTFYIGPPPQPATPRRGHWATLGTATNNLYSSPKMVYTHYITLLFYFNWIWRRSLKFAKLWALGGPPPGPPWWPHVPYEHLWIPSPWGWFLPSLVKIQPCISSRSRFWTITFYIWPPPQPVTPHGGHWGHPGKCHQQPLSFT